MAIVMEYGLMPQMLKELDESLSSDAFDVNVFSPAREQSKRKTDYKNIQKNRFPCVNILLLSWNDLRTEWNAVRAKPPKGSKTRGKFEVEQDGKWTEIEESDSEGEDRADNTQEDDRMFELQVKYAEKHSKIAEEFVGKTFYDLRFSFIFYDEVHLVRNPDTERFAAARRLSSRGEVVIGMSASPMWNSPLDTINVVRAMGARLAKAPLLTSVPKNIFNPTGMGEKRIDKHYTDCHNDIQNLMRLYFKLENTRLTIQRQIRDDAGGLCGLSERQALRRKRAEQARKLAKENADSETEDDEEAEVVDGVDANDGSEGSENDEGDDDSAQDVSESGTDPESDSNSQKESEDEEEDDEEKGNGDGDGNDGSADEESAVDSDANENIDATADSDEEDDVEALANEWNLVLLPDVPESKNIEERWAKLRDDMIKQVMIPIHTLISSRWIRRIDTTLSCDGPILSLPNVQKRDVFVPLTAEQRKEYEMAGGSTNSLPRGIETIARLALVKLSPKLDYLIGELKKNLAADARLPQDKKRKFVVYVHWVRGDLLDPIVDYLAKAGIPAATVNGKMSADHRANVVETFQKDADHSSTKGKHSRVLVISDCSSAGVNLQRANVVYMLDQAWTMAKFDQISGRVLRLGQKRAVEIVNVFVERTIDSGMRFTQIRKERLIRALDKDAHLMAPLLKPWVKSIEAPEPDSRPAKKAKLQ